MLKRILFLSDVDSAHTRKWAVSLHDRGYEIGIFSLRKSGSDWHEKYPSIKNFDSDGFQKEKFQGGTLSKLGYLKMIPSLRKIIADFKPTIVHAHYATSYGTLGVRSGFHPLVISVWGSDVFEFPAKSWLHKRLVKRNLRKADAVFSTSEVMKQQVVKLGRDEVHVTPFGVDLSIYFPNKGSALFSDDTRVIGTIKTLERHYGIDVLIRAFEIVKRKYTQKLKLVICGTGTQESELKALAATSEWKNDILFTGAIAQEDVPEYLNQFDVFANLSLQESFGVAVIEAMACGVPTVVSDAVGLREVTGEGDTALIVPAGNAEDAADAILRYLENSELAAEKIKKGRNRVLENYDWQQNLSAIEELYTDLNSRFQHNLNT